MFGVDDVRPFLVQARTALQWVVRKRLLATVLIAIGLAWLCLVWPTLWEYRTEYWESPFKPYPRNVRVELRRHRLTGQEQMRRGETDWGPIVVW